MSKKSFDFRNTAEKSLWPNATISRKKPDFDFDTSNFFTCFRFPPWIHAQIANESSDFNRLALKPYEFWTATDEMKKFYSGFLLKEMFDRFSSKLNSSLSPNRSLWLYMAHDLTVQEVLSDLGLKAVSGQNGKENISKCRINS